jgi:hypothetical protein
MRYALACVGVCLLPVRIPAIEANWLLGNACKLPSESANQENR